MRENWKPKKLKFSIGGYGGDIFILEWRKKGLALESEGMSGLLAPTDVFVHPDKKAWVNFWQAMDQIRVWEWASDYSAYVFDGTSWSLKLSYGNKTIETHGHMAFPDPNDLSKKVDIEQSPPFRKLINALNKLSGRKFITY